MRGHLILLCLAVPLLMAVSLPMVSEEISGYETLSAESLAVRKRFSVVVSPDDPFRQQIAFQCVVQSPPSEDRPTILASKAWVEAQGRKGSHERELEITPQLSKLHDWQRPGVGTRVDVTCAGGTTCVIPVAAYCRLDVQPDTNVRVQWILTATVTDNGSCMGKPDTAIKITRVSGG